MNAFLLLFIISAVLVTRVAARDRNNVCKNAFDYDTKLSNKNCWYNPDVDLTVIITQHNYPLEVYNVTTQDGYVLQLFRIPRGKYLGNSTRKSRQPVFLQHGILASCAAYVINGNESIAFLLADNGYDIWLGNSRGSTYGKGHIKLSVNDVRYWNFSYHEMGVYDLPSSLDLVNHVTGRNDIIFIGQSMGTNLPYVYATENPKHAKQRIKLIINLAPTVFLLDVKTPIALICPLWPILQRLSRKLRLVEILPNSPYLKRRFYDICLQSGFELTFCETIVFVPFGFDYEQFKPESLPVILSHYPAGTSANTIIHLMQGTVSGDFAHYDYGEQMNLKYYNSTRPPSYDLSKVTMPNFIIYGANDWVASEKGSYMLYNKLPVTIGIYKIPYRKFSHIDFFFAKDVVPELIFKLLKVMSLYRVDR